MLLAILLALPPNALTFLLMVGCDGSVGWGTPISPTNVLTAYHVVDECNEITIKDYKGQFITSTAKVAWHDKKGYPDVAMLTTMEAQSWQIVFISKDRLMPGEEVFWNAYLKGLSWAPVAGRYMGTDEDNDMVLDGWVGPGTSGSGLLNSKGELVGVLESLFSMGGTRTPPRSLGGAVRIDRWPK